MPVYDFQCYECGLRFEKFAKVTDQEKECSTCGKMAPRCQSGSFSFSFNQKVTAPVPQNTGVASFDRHVDRVIGQSAALGWSHFEDRQSEKRHVMREHQLESPHAVGIGPDGTYRPMTSQEIRAASTARNLNNKAMEVINGVPKEERAKKVHVKKVD